MLSGLSGMSSYYLMYQRGSGYGRSLGYAGQMQRMQSGRQQAQNVQGMEGKALPETKAQEDGGMPSAAGATGPKGIPAAYQGTGEIPDLFIRKGVDPVEYAVKMRIQYVGDQTAEGAEEVSGKQIDSVQEAAKEGECQTCEQRKYQDGSDDMGVSFQTPTKISPEAAGAAVRGHEQEHVSREQAKAKREGKEVVSQSVVIHTSVCPECGKVYVSGGTTKTTTASKPETPDIAGEAQVRKPFSAVA